MQNKSQQGIDYFNRGHWLTNIQVKTSLRARRKMYELWKGFVVRESQKKEFPQSLRVVDIGATPDCERQDSNCMLNWFLEDKAQLALYSPEDVSNLTQKLPGVIVLQKMPSTPQFDWVTSSAVLEHVGTIKDQKSFVNSLSKTGNGLFLTTPNRWHWLEFHTKIPFLHWLPKKLHRALLKRFGLQFWANEKNLNLLGKKELLKIADDLTTNFDVEIRSIKTLGMTSNWVLLARRKSKKT
ncbi:MAG: hypothetical protein AB7F43_08680 [Bacteriovoracia bacterium]